LQDFRVSAANIFEPARVLGRPTFVSDPDWDEQDMFYRALSWTPDRLRRNTI
jgi:hypothetical protein